MNVTLSINETVVKKARALARRQGSSLNALIRRHLESLIGRRSGPDTAREYFELIRNHPGRSGGKKFRREDAYFKRT